MSTIAEGATSTRQKRAKATAYAIILIALVGSSVLLAAHPLSAHSTTVAPGTLPSWNPAVSCTANLTTIEGVIGNQQSAYGGATYGGGGFLPGIPNKRSTSPPCTVNGNATFVEIHGIQMVTLSYAIEDCANYPNGNFCDTTFNAQDPKCTNSDIYMCRIHLEIDQAWKSAGVAPQNPGVTTQLLDVQGFAFWDPEHTTADYHSFSGWEIHPLTAWRLSNSTTPDFSISSNPGKLTVPQGSTTTATITVNSLDGFAGTVTLSATVNPTIASTTSVSLNPSSVSAISGGSAASTLTAQVSQSTPTGYWTITIKGASGTLVHTLLVTLLVTKPPPDFSISASPTSTSVSVGSSGTSTITLTSLYNFTGTVTLTAQVTPTDTTSSISPAPPTASFNPASVTLTAGATSTSTLSTSTSLLSTPGTYTVTITGNSGTLVHSTTVTVTVTLV